MGNEHLVGNLRSTAASNLADDVTHLFDISPKSIYGAMHLLATEEVGKAGSAYLSA